MNFRSPYRWNVLGVSIPVIALLIAGSFFGGFVLGSDGQTKAAARAITSELSDQPPVGVDFSPLWKTWRVLDEKFVPSTTTESVNDQEKLWGTIQGLAISFGDPYTVFLPPQQSEIFEEDIRGSFGGVGIEIGMRDNILTVIAPLKDTPGDRAGIQSGDQIIKVDGTSTERLSIDEAVSLIRGEVGTVVSLTLLRDGANDLIIADVVRAIIEIPTITAELRADGVFVIELFNFSAISPDLFRDALREFVISGSNKLLLDLRGNPGGFLEASVNMASWFLPTGKVVVRESGRNGKNVRTYRSKGFDIFNKNLKMIILVNRGSASASEILAGALREHGIATLVGEKTFGKGSVQELVDITDTTALKVTIAQWLTPNGISISADGLIPDVVVEMTSEDIEAGEDPQFDKAVELLLTDNS